MIRSIVMSKLASLCRRLSGTLVVKFCLVAMVSLFVYGLFFRLLDGSAAALFGSAGGSLAFEWTDKVLGVTIALAGSYVAIEIAQRGLRNSEEISAMSFHEKIQQETDNHNRFFQTLERLAETCETITNALFEKYLAIRTGETRSFDAELETLYRRLMADRRSLYNAWMGLRDSLSSDTAVDDKSRQAAGKEKAAPARPGFGSMTYGAANRLQPDAIDKDELFEIARAGTFTRSQYNALESRLFRIFDAEWRRLALDVLDEKFARLRQALADLRDRDPTDAGYDKWYRESIEADEETLARLQEWRADLVTAAGRRDSEAFDAIACQLEDLDLTWHGRPLQATCDDIDRRMSDLQTAIEDAQSFLDYSDALEQARIEEAQACIRFAIEEPLELADADHKRAFFAAIASALRERKGRLSVEDAYDAVARQPNFAFHIQAHVLSDAIYTSPAQSRCSDELDRAIEFNIGLGLLIDFLDELPEDITKLVLNRLACKAPLVPHGAIRPTIGLRVRRIARAALRDPRHLVRQPVEEGETDLSWEGLQGEGENVTFLGREIWSRAKWLSEALEKLHEDRKLREAGGPTRQRLSEEEESQTDSRFVA